MDLWLDINKLDSGLSNSVNFKYAFTTSSTSNTTEVIASGNFNGKKAGNKIRLLDSETFSASDTSTYYLWIWLDANETSSDTMDQSFSLSLNGSCTDAIPVEPNAPDLDDGMIPVVISDTGITKTISKDDTSWYNYKKKQWANVVLVNSSSRSKYLNTSGVTVSETDILAYYVWIPRYKYKIWSIDNSSKKGKEQEIQIVFENKNDVAYVPNVNIYASCASVENPNFVDYPECYGAPYSVTTEEKQKLITWWHSFISAEMNTSYTLEQATTDVNEVMIKGSVIPQGLPEDAIIDFPLMINLYNENNDPDITYTTEFNSSNNFTGPREIDIVFENKTATKQNGDAIDTYHTHPAFTFGGVELNGIWVGKFETTGSASVPTVKGNNASLVNQNVSTQFTTAQKLGTSAYGSTSKVDSHMMKNSEWGAVAYLSHSKYGTNKEIRINNYNNNGYLTGCGANTENESQSNTCGIVYGNATNYPQSTTGNITGAYDMSGGALEYVMGYYSGASTTWGAVSYYNYAGFSSKPASKYFDDYTTTNPLTACNGGICYGHGLSEVNKWYGGYAGFVDAELPWFSRGGRYDNGASAGAFYFGSVIGNADDFFSFRVVLSPIGA